MKPALLALLLLASTLHATVKQPNPFPNPPQGCDWTVPAGGPNSCCPTEAACPIK